MLIQPKITATCALNDALIDSDLSQDYDNGELYLNNRTIKSAMNQYDGTLMVCIYSKNMYYKNITSVYCMNCICNFNTCIVCNRLALTPVPTRSK